MALFRPHRLLAVALALGGFGALGLHPSRAQAASLTVTNLSDGATDGTCSAAGTGDGCTLREAISAANANADQSDIVIDASLTGTIALQNSLPYLNTNLSITDVPGTVTINAGNAGFGVLNVSNNAAIVLNGLTLTGGVAENGGGLGVSTGSVTLNRCGIVNNRANTYGAGLYAEKAALALNNCTVSGNAAPYGAGIFADYGATFALTNSTIANNTADGVGGGFCSRGTSATLSNCTLAGNTAQNGGGIFGVEGTLTVGSCTITANKASLGRGGGIQTDTAVSLGNSIVALNNGSDLDPYSSNGSFATTGYNLVGTGSADVLNSFNKSGDRTGVTSAQLKLGALQDNGGGTSTVAIQSGSIAINAGDTSLATDQRGIARPQSTRDDVGAFELNTFTESLIVTTLSDEDDGTSDSGVGAGTSLREAINYANSNADQSAITFAPQLASGTINLQRVLPTLSTNLSIVSSSNLVINAANLGFRVLTVDSGTTSGPTVALAGLDLINGVSSGSVGGGGLANLNGTVALERCSVSYNSSASRAGGILNLSGLSLNNCSVFSNTASHGAGLFAESGSSLTVTNSSLYNNKANAYGGGLYSRTNVSLNNSSIFGNTATTGGGGIFHFVGTLTASNCTIANNRVPVNGGSGIQTAATVTLSNSIVATNGKTDLDTFNSGGTFTSTGYNLVGASGTNALTGFNKAGDKTGVTSAQLQFGAVSQNGGPTLTIPLDVSSIAYNAGNPDVAPNANSFDQRGQGYARVAGGRIDVGAYESQVPAFVTVKGRVYNAVAFSGLPGIVVNAVRQSDGKAFAVGTDTNGNYSLKLAPAIYTFAAIFPHKPGFIIYPAFANPVTFTGSPTALPSYDFRAVGITGRIISPANVGISGVTLNLYAQNDTTFKTALRTATTDSNGFFSLDGVSAGTYLVVPVAPTAYTYTPVTRTVTVVDKAVFTSFTARVKSAPKTLGGARSSVTLSSVSANAQAGTLTLKFTGPLDVASSAELSHYSAQVDGEAVSVESAQLSGNDTIVLIVSPDALAAGTSLSLGWVGLLDAQGLPVQGETTLTN